MLNIATKLFHPLVASAEKSVSIKDFFGQSSFEKASHLAHSSKVTAAELAMTQFIAMQ